MQLGSHTHTHTHRIGAMDHLPSNYSPFRQQLEGSWFRSHLNSSAWHTSFQCAVVCVDAHRSVCPLHVGQDGTELHVDAHGQHSQKCVFTLGQDGTELHVDAHGQHSQKCVFTLGQNGTELHVDAHGQHSQKCVCTVGQDGMHMAGSTHETYGKQARQCQITGGFKQSGPHQSGQQYV